MWWGASVQWKYLRLLHICWILYFIVLLLWNGTFTGIHCIFYVLLQHKLPIGTNKLETWTWNLIKANHLNIWVIYLQLTTEDFLLHDGLREKSVVQGRSKRERGLWREARADEEEGLIARSVAQVEAFKKSNKNDTAVACCQCSVSWPHFNVFSSLNFQ